MCTFSVFITLLWIFYKRMTCLSHNKVFSRISPLGCCINLHCTNAPISPFSPLRWLPILSKWMRREKSAFRYKNTTQKEGQRLLGIFFFVLSLFQGFFVLFGVGVRDVNLSWVYLKQTGPMSKPNSWSAPPMSIGAMSRMGRRDGLSVLYSITVLLHSPVCLCRCKGKWFQILVLQRTKTLCDNHFDTKVQFRQIKFTILLFLQAKVKVVFAKNT